MFRRRKEDNIIKAKKGNKEAFINLIEENLISMYRVEKRYIAIAGRYR